MKKKNMSMAFIQITFFSFLFFLVVALSYSYAMQPNDWFVVILTAQFLRVPFILYLLGLALIIGLVASILLYELKRREWQHI